MAVVVTPLVSRVSLTLQTGIDGEGNPVLHTVSYSGIKSTAADQDVFDVAQALAGLQQHSLHQVSRVDEEEMAEGA